MCLNNIGCLYENEKKYLEALEYHQKVLIIKNFHLPNNHLNLSVTYNNLATIYDCIGLTLENICLINEMKGDFSQGKLFYEKAALIRHHILSSTHCDVIQIEQDIKQILMKIK
ncbi:unnamed protein product [Rotaria sordida]|uniref:Uncharacterized protein n=1 Tax=Rotaria sordida TaxID=392033 RepID=A0A820G864_9BILA|nr:unnamed protein product [Rotaria sordida]